MDNKQRDVIKKNLDSVKKIRSALKRKNSLTLTLLVELVARNRVGSGGEKAACKQLNINYKLFRYLLDSNDELAIHVKRTLNKARAYSATLTHETVVRKAVSKAKKNKSSSK